MSNLLGYLVRAYNESKEPIGEYDFLKRSEADQWFEMLNDDFTAHHIELWEIYDDNAELVLETDKIWALNINHDEWKFGPDVLDTGIN